jgi:putative ABC transport system permease protein
MFRNHLKVALRTLWRERGYTAINVIGLAVGLGCCLLVALFVREELSYDAFHDGGERVLFIAAEDAGGGSVQAGMATPYPLAGALEQDLPLVARAGRVLWPGDGEVRVGNEPYSTEEGVYHADGAFFDLFSFPVVAGDTTGLLEAPNTAVVTPGFAEKHFSGEDPVGKTFTSSRYGEHEYTVVAVARSRENSYLDFNALLSFSTLGFEQSHGSMWGARMFLTFARLRPGASPDAFAEELNGLARRHLGEERRVGFAAQPVGGLYLSDLVSVDGFQGDWRYVYLFASIALIILVLACVNYANLMTARAARRAREVGVRRAVGGTRAHLAGQFLLEAVLVAGGAYALALGMAGAALPAFNQLFGTDLALDGGALGLVGLLGGGAALSGLAAGAYPALYLSAVRPAEVLRGSTAEGPSGAGLRKGLVVFQFAVAVALLIATGIVLQQLRYAQEKDLGFSGEQVAVLDPPDARAEAFAKEALGAASVPSASVAQAVPGGFNLTLGVSAGSLTDSAGVDPDESVRVHPAVVDTGYVETLGLEVIAGRPFDPSRRADREEAKLINETAARALGWTPDEAIGRSFSPNDTPGRVVGVVADFHTASLREPIKPVVLQLRPIQGMSGGKKVAVRLASGRVTAGLDHLRRVWARMSDQPFTYSFLDQTFAELYRTERRLARVFGVFAGLAVFIACLGLLGLAAYAAQRRRREVAIRKVLGATARQIVGLLSRDFLGLVGLAFLVGAPLAYVAMQRWLADFAYRVDVGPGVFAGALAAATAVALVAVSTQALRAAWTDPADAIRRE